MSEQSHFLVELRDAIRHLDRKMDSRFDLVDRRFVGVDRRSATIEHRIEGIDGRFEQMDRRLGGLERRIDGLDDKLSRHFLWLVGTQVTTLVAIVGALLARS
jgi:hypothetical protein